MTRTERHARIDRRLDALRRRPSDRLDDLADATAPCGLLFGVDLLVCVALRALAWGMRKIGK